MNSFSFTLSGKHFICPSFLNESFTGQSNLGCRSLLFMTLNASFQPLLSCRVSFEKSDDSLMGRLSIRAGNPHRCVVTPYVGERSEREQCHLVRSLPVFSHFCCYPQANWALLVLIPRWIGLCMF